MLLPGVVMPPRILLRGDVLVGPLLCSAPARALALALLRSGLLPPFGSGAGPALALGGKPRRLRHGLRILGARLKRILSHVNSGFELCRRSVACQLLARAPLRPRADGNPRASLLQNRRLLLGRDMSTILQMREPQLGHAVRPDIGFDDRPVDHRAISGKPRYADSGFAASACRVGCASTLRTFVGLTATFEPKWQRN